MNIIMIVTALPPSPAGGAELQAMKLGAALKKKGVTVSFLLPGKGRLRGNSSVDGMPVHRLHSIFSRAFEWLSRWKKNGANAAFRVAYDDRQEVTDEITRKAGWPTWLYYHIFFWQALVFLWPRRRSIDIIHAHTMEWSAIVSARLGRLLKKPVIIKESTMNGFRSLARFPSGRSLQAMVIRNAYFVSMTRTIRENLLQSGVPEKKIVNIPNGIVADGAVLSRKTGQEPVKILFVGNLYQQPAKGIDILLRAWPIIQDRFPGALLQVVGDGLNPAYGAFTDSLGISQSVRFLGKQSDLAGYYAGADLFVLPSRREGMSNALMEAMLHAVPCVATDISGSRDLISNQVNGLLVPPADPEALADAIGYLLSNPDLARSFGVKGRETVIRGFAMPAIADRYISFYETLLKTEA